MDSTITAARLEAVSGKMDRKAREYAHGRYGLEGTPDERAQDFAEGYVLAVARVCGGLAADQCAEGEEWEPKAWLQGDEQAVREAAALVEVELDRAAWRKLWEIYCEGDTRAAFAA